MSFVQDILDSHVELESPISFWYWSALAIISAVVKDNIYINRGGAYKLYPNIYVMLHAKSGLKKGPPIGLAKDLVKRVNNTRIISGRSSIQGILKELGTAYTSPGGKVNSPSKAFIVASEFSSSLVNDPAALTILTDLYDRMYNEGEYRSLLKMESFNLKDPTLTMLVATNESHFDDFIAQKDVHGGFIGRMFMIHESKRNTINSLVRPLSHPPNRDDLANQLKVISTLQGEMTGLWQDDNFTDVGKLYDEWYNKFSNDFDSSGVEDKTGTIQRFGDSVLKVAILLSLSNEPSLVLGKNAMEEAILVCEKLIGNVRRTTMKSGKSSFAVQKAIIIDELMKRENHMVSRTQLLKKYYLHFDSAMLDDVIPLLEGAGIIRSEAHGSTVVYIMPNAQVMKMENFMKGKVEKDD